MTLLRAMNNDKHTIIRYQSNRLNEHDIIICNGQVIKDTETRQVYINELFEFELKASKKKSPWCGKVNGWIFVKGLFSQKDESGRRMSFVFLSNNNNFTDEMNKAFQIVNKTLDHRTKETIKSYKLRCYTIMGIVLLIAITLVVQVLRIL